MTARSWWRAVLVAAVTTSICGNIYHALLTAPPGLRVPAAIMSALPPLAVVGITEGLMRSAGAGVRPAAYWAGVAGGVGIALIAFVLSFWALRALAITLGEPASVAAGLPLLTDLLVAVSSVMLLSFRPVSSVATVDVPVVSDLVFEPSPVRSSVPEPGATSTVNISPVEREPAPAAVVHEREFEPVVPAASPEPVAAAAAVHSQPVAEPASASEAPAAHERRPAASRGVTPITAARTSIDRHSQFMAVAEDLWTNGLRVRRGKELVAAVLQDRAGGMNPTAMAEAHAVHHSVVTKILAAADQRAG